MQAILADLPVMCEPRPRRARGMVRVDMIATAKRLESTERRVSAWILYREMGCLGKPSPSFVRTYRELVASGVIPPPDPPHPNRVAATRLLRRADFIPDDLDGRTTIVREAKLWKAQRGLSPYLTPEELDVVLPL